MEKLKNLPTIEQREQADFQKAKKIERIIGVLNCDGWQDVKEILLSEANSDELIKKLAKLGSTDFQKIGELTYLEARANDKVKSGIMKVENYKR